MQMPLQQLMEGFAERCGLPAPEPAADGDYRFTFDEELEVRCFESGGSLYLEATLGRVPEDEREAGEYVARLLRINLARVKSQAETLACDPEGGDLVLFRSLAMGGLTPRAFDEVMEDFVNTLDFWAGAVSRPERHASPALRPGVGMLFP